MQAAIYTARGIWRKSGAFIMRIGVKRWQTDTDRTKTVHTAGRLRKTRRESMRHRQCAGYAGSLLILP